ncbi:MAG: ribonuclease P protein component [Acidobacteria bacterium]|nr:ribonuclease P protein component [Acidobacteriota bacterium]
MNGPAGESNDSEPAPETFSKDQRIRRRSDYNRIYEEGRKLHGRYVVIFVIPGGTSRSRLGITVTKKAGRAHDRNQLKRRVREIFRRAPARKELDESPIDIVVNVKPAAKVATFEDLERDLIGAIRRAKRHGES